MKKIPMWIPPEYTGMFWFGIVSAIVVVILTLFVNPKTWVALPICGLAIAIGRWPHIKRFLEEAREFFRSFYVG